MVANHGNDSRLKTETADETSAVGLFYLSLLTIERMINRKRRK
jgi:hypothetical protein